MNVRMHMDQYIVSSRLGTGLCFMCMITDASVKVNYLVFSTFKIEHIQCVKCEILRELQCSSQFTSIQKGGHA